MKAAISLLTLAMLVSCQPKKDVAAEPEKNTPPAEDASAKPEAPAAIDVSKTDSLIGQPLEDVKTACKAAGVRCRVVELDGQPLPATMDFDEARLNFKVQSGKITAVTKG